jgi:hypothetical protein
LPLIFSAAVIILVFVALRFQLSERQRIAKKLSDRIFNGGGLKA